MRIDCRYLLQFDKNNKAFLLENKRIEVKDSLISSIKDISDDSKADVKLDHHIVMPGLINTHTHIAMSLFRGIADDTSLFKWLNEYIFPLENEFLSPSFITLGSELGFLESLKSGVTTIADMYPLYVKQIADVMTEFGLRGVLGYGVNDFIPEFKKPVNELLSEFKDNSLVSISLAPHAPYTCSDSFLEQIQTFRKEKNLAVFIHVCETKKEVKDSLDKYGKTPVQRLHDLGLTGKDCLYAHCVHLSKEDIQILKQTGTKVAYNPHSNMKLASGKAPIYELLQEGIEVGLGTDGVASNNQLNFFSEMKTGLLLQKTFLERGDEMTAHDALLMATKKGAQVLNFKNLGEIKENYLADIIGVDISGISFAPDHDLISHLVYSSFGNEVDFVMCNGKTLMENKQQKIIDETKLISKVNHQAKQMREFLKSKSS